MSTTDKATSTEPTSAPLMVATTEHRRATQALLMVAEEPLELTLLAQLLEVHVDVVAEMLNDIAHECKERNAGYELVNVGGGFRYQTHPDVSAYVERFVINGQNARMSNAALETLAIIAYKQPVSRTQIAAIRGVNADGVVRTLVQRGYVEERGRSDHAGQAVLLGTTRLFLERMGLNSLADLPPLGEFVPDSRVVEALEQGLRVEQEAPETPATPASADAAVPVATHNA